jgi:hypothetical protein
MSIATPGSEIPITVSYKKFIPKTSVRMYCAMVNLKTSMRIPFLAQDIDVPSSGSGAVHTSFKVPYNSLFSDKTASWTV